MFTATLPEPVGAATHVLVTQERREAGMYELVGVFGAMTGEEFTSVPMMLPFRRNIDGAELDAMYEEVASHGAPSTPVQECRLADVVEWLDEYGWVESTFVAPEPIPEQKAEPEA